MATTRVRIFYPADPAGVVPGGVDSYLRGLIQWAPTDIEFSLVGVTTDNAARPVGVWSNCTLGNRSFQFLPLLALDKPGRRGLVPLSLRYTIALACQREARAEHFDVMEFHRVEPAALFARDHRPRTFVVHTDMSVIGASTQSDVLWRFLPGGYRRIESFALCRSATVWCVSHPIFSDLAARYPQLGERLQHISNWVDPGVFRPASPSERQKRRKAIATATGADCAGDWIAFAGRLDTTKDPHLLLDAAELLIALGRPIHLILVGDGRLRDSLAARVRRGRLSGRVHFLGLRGPQEVATILSACDAFALTSSYEGMPIAVLEALACGLPVAATDVGDVRLVVQPGRTGAIAVARSAEAVASALEQVLESRSTGGSHATAEAVSAFHPAAVLEPVYSRYRKLASNADT